METNEAESSTPQRSVVSSVVMVNNKKKAGGLGETSKAKYLERVKDLYLDNLACRQELVEVLVLKNLSHEDLSNHYCVDWLKAHEAHFSRDKTLETADLTAIPELSIMGPVNYRPLKELGKPGDIVEPPKHLTSTARIRVAIPAQLRALEKLLAVEYGASRCCPHGLEAGRRPKVWEISWELTASQNCGSLRSLGSWSSESNHRGGI